MRKSEPAMTKTATTAMEDMAELSALLSGKEIEV